MFTQAKKTFCLNKKILQPVDGVLELGSTAINRLQILDCLVKIAAANETVSFAAPSSLRSTFRFPQCSFVRSVLD